MIIEWVKKNRWAQVILALIWVGLLTGLDRLILGGSPNVSIAIFCTMLWFVSMLLIAEWTKK